MDLSSLKFYLNSEIVMIKTSTILALIVFFATRGVESHMSIEEIGYTLVINLMFVIVVLISLPFVYYIFNSVIDRLSYKAEKL